MNSKEFAKLIGVSQPTVSRALNDNPLVPEEKRKWIKEKAREYGFVLNTSARSLRTNRTDTIGILFPKHFVGMTENPMMAYLYDKIQIELHKHGFDIMVVYSDTDEEDLTALERMIRTKKVDGFLILKLEMTNAERALIEQEKTPCVCMMNAASKIRDDISYYFSDSEYGGYLAGEYLGRYPEYQKMYISYSGEKADNKRRYDGYCKGLKEHGVEESEILRLECDLSMESGYQLVLDHKDLLLNQKSAILVYCDMIATGVIQGLNEIGAEIPQQVQLIGMDDLPMSANIRPGLSTIHVNAENMVPAACTHLIDMINGKKKAEDEVTQIWLKPSLVLRGTTK